MQILEHMESYGSVEGVLEVLSSRGSLLYFSLKDVLTGKRVRCNFNEDLVAQALEAWRKRVVVFGRIRADNLGNPRTVLVWSISVLPLPEELQQLEEIKGVSPDMTGGLSSEKYAKERRLVMSQDRMRLPDGEIPPSTSPRRLVSSPSAERRELADIRLGSSVSK